MSGNDIKAKAEANFNSIGICGDGQSLARLVGLDEDMLDYYYRLRTPRGAYSEKKYEEKCWSAVGWFIPLRGVIPERAYDFLEHIFCLNGCPPAERFISTVANRESNIRMYGEDQVKRAEADGWLASVRPLED